MGRIKEDSLNRHQRHEDFKSRLINDVFGEDNKGKVPMDKVMLLIWQFRDDPTVVEFMAQFVSRFANSRDVFDGIEFYLPQLAHMIIHLEANWNDAILEQFALIISQHSLHFALQFTWILEGAIEDYQPETPEGKPNRHYNPLFYSRCIKILSNIERCVVYGTPHRHELQRLYEKGQISKQEYEILEHADTRFNAAQIADNLKYSVIDVKTGLFMDTQITGGNLLYKRQLRSSRCKTKRWKSRYFAVHERMLHCYNHHPSGGGRLIRAMPLEGATIYKTSVEKAKYPFMFEVHNLSFFFQMRATDDTDRDRWITILKEESESNVLFPHHAKDKLSTLNTRESDRDSYHMNMQIIEDLSLSQKSRYLFFKCEREFVRSLCEVAENLRLQERETRKSLAPGYVDKLKIPSCVYLPMCNSTDIWRRVNKSIPNDTRVFNTKERCPVLIYFATKKGGKVRYSSGVMKDVDLDVVEYLREHYEVFDNSSQALTPIYCTKMQRFGVENLPSYSKFAELEKIDNSIQVNYRKTSTTTDDNLILLEDTNITRNHEFQGSKDDVDHMSATKSMVWSDSPKYLKHSEKDTTGELKKFNPHVARFVKESLAKIPSKVSSRIRNVKRTIALRSMPESMIEKVPMELVPIVESRTDDDDNSALSNISRNTMRGNKLIYTHDLGKDGMGTDIFERVKPFICGKESWTEKCERICQEIRKQDHTSDLESVVTSDISGIMAKSNDDIRQEVFVMQMIHYYKSVFAKSDLPIWLKTYRILSTSKSTGLIEVIVDAISIDSLKKNKSYPRDGGLRAYFEKVYGPSTSKPFKVAQKNFILSLVGYSLVSYLLGLKDRHNGNIMIDLRGHMIFIDFGFAMGMAPGHEFSFERAPFKLTQEYIDVMGGIHSECFVEFKRLFVAGFLAARANSQIALGLVEIMMHKSNYPCFSGSRYGGNISLKRFQSRLMLKIRDEDVPVRALRLVEKSISHIGTILYDYYQKISNGYAI